MYYREFLGQVHESLKPRTYLEVGIRDGSSLALSRTRSVAIDPDFAIRQELCCDVQLVKTTSDEYFAREDTLSWFNGEPIGFGFIDGLHLFEFAFRDFINVEAHSEWWSVVILDDMLPRLPIEAARDRKSVAWTGDVFKVLPVLQAHRSDLIVLPVHTNTTGLLVILGLDPSSRVLTEKYDDIYTEHVTADPQQIDDTILDRTDAWSAAALAGSPLWSFLRDAREQNMTRADGLPRLRELVESLRVSLAADFDALPIARPEPVDWPTPSMLAAERRKAKAAARAAARS